LSNRAHQESKGIHQQFYNFDSFSFIATCQLFLNRELKVAEHSFQEPMPNSRLLLSYLCFGVKVNHRRVYYRILAKVCAVAMATGLDKNKA